MDNKEFSEGIKNGLSIDQVTDLLNTFGANPQMKNDIIVAQTVCHGGHSHKLYYYEKTNFIGDFFAFMLGIIFAKSSCIT